MTASLTRLSAIAAGHTKIALQKDALRKVKDATTARLKREVAAKRRARRKGRAG